MKSDGCLYGSKVVNSEKCVDCTNVFDSQYCYELNDSSKCYKVFFSKFCNNSKELYFCSYCNNCEECILSNGLIHKKYYIKNKKYSKEEYFLEKEKYLKNLKKSKKEISNKIIVKDVNQINSENCIGNNIINSFNSSYCFDVQNIKNCKFSSNMFSVQDCYDYESRGDNCSLIYESIGVGTNSSKVFFGINTISNSNNIFYSALLNGSNNLFGCIGLRNKQYCILNKQYTKEKYEKLVPKIIKKMIEDGEWGEFFPASLSPFGYNETIAGEYFPLNKEKILRQNFNYSDYEPPFPKVEKVIPAEKLPEDISKIPDDILNWAIECEVSKKPFRIIKQELEFYRKHNLPIPKKHPDIRHSERMKLRNPRKLFDRNCDKCGVEIKSTYSPDREEIVYCEKCYEKEVY